MIIDVCLWSANQEQLEMNTERYHKEFSEDKRLEAFKDLVSYTIGWDGLYDVVVTYDDGHEDYYAGLAFELMVKNMIRSSNN